MISMRRKLRGSIRPGFSLAGAVAALCFLRSGASGGETNIERLDYPSSELIGGPSLNTTGNTPIRLADQRGKVVILHFWTFG